MDWSIILNVVFGTGLVATIVGLFSIRSELKKARAEAEKAMAEADTVKITNTEQATRILIDNIVKPLTEKLDETHRELQGNKRELAKLRKAVEAIQLCPYRGECPVLDELQDVAGDRTAGKEGQSQGRIVGGDGIPKRSRARPSGHGGRKVIHKVAGRQPSSRCGVQCSDTTGEGVAEETGRRGIDFDCPGHHPGKGDDDHEGEV